MSIAPRNTPAPPDRAVDLNDLRTLSSAAFAQLGVPDLVYVRPVVVNGETAYAIHAADGTEVAAFASHDLALGMALQNDMEPMSVH